MGIKVADSTSSTSEESRDHKMICWTRTLYRERKKGLIRGRQMTIIQYRERKSVMIVRTYVDKDIR